VTLAAAKEYDGTKTLTGSQLTIGTGITGESVGYSAATINSKDVKDNAINYVDSVTLADNGTTLASNYKAPSAAVAAGKNAVALTKANLTATFSDVTTVYGTNASNGLVTFLDKFGTDDVSAGSAGLVGAAFSTSGNLKAGTYVQSVGGVLSGADAGNYTFSGTSSANYVVNKLAVGTQIADVNTVYGVAAKTGSASLQGTVAGDKVSLVDGVGAMQGASFSTSGQLKAGTYKQSVGAALTGADADNYTAAPTSVANYVVTPKAITATVSAADKAYDGSNVATMTAGSADVVLGDVVTVLGVTGTFASKNVARDSAGNVLAQVVTAFGRSAGLGGADSSNYTLSGISNVASTTAKITPKDLTVTGITANDKVYDGSTAAAINASSAVLAGLVGGDSVSVSTQAGVGNFASKNVAFDGSGAVASQAVAVSGLSLNGADAGNYNVTDKSGATAKVLQRALSITGSVAQDKTVDGTTQATVKAGQLVNLVAGESLVVTATGQFDTADVGVNKAVATTYALTNGSNGVASNYIKPLSEVLRAAILAATVNPVQPVVNPAKAAGSSRVAVAGSTNSGAALGVADGDEPVNPEQCSVLNPEKCECQTAGVAGVEWHSPKSLDTFHSAV
jgi:hypothetical protein